jgi:hypothetical protein
MYYDREDMHWFYYECRLKAKRACKMASNIKSWLMMKMVLVILWVMKVAGIVYGKLYGQFGYNRAAWEFREVHEAINSKLNRRKEES